MIARWLRMTPALQSTVVNRPDTDTLRKLRTGITVGAGRRPKSSTSGGWMYLLKRGSNLIKYILQKRFNYALQMLPLSPRSH
jgi:hypothetical protein